MTWEIKIFKIKQAIGWILWGFNAHRKEQITMWGCNEMVIGGLRDLGWQLTHCWPCKEK